MKPVTVEEFYHGLSGEVQPVARRLRALIRAEAPGCTEAIKYGMPAFLLAGKVFLYLGVWKKHIALYPLYVTEDPGFETLVAPFRTEKDTLHFSLKSPMPEAVISAVAAFKARASQSA